MKYRLSDAELAARVREGNIRRSTKRREKLLATGHKQLLIWTSADTQARIDAIKDARDMTLQDTVNLVLVAGLDALEQDPASKGSGNDE